MSFKKIVCGVTGSEHGQKAAEEAARQAKSDQAELVLVYVVDISFLKGIAIQLTSDFAQKTLEHIGTHILEQAEERVKAQGVIPKKIIRHGEVLEVLKQILKEEKADLLVLGHEDRSFFEKVLFKGEVEDHIQEIQDQIGISVMVVP